MALQRIWQDGDVLTGVGLDQSLALVSTNLADGTLSAPSLSFASNQTTGLYLKSDGSLGAVISGTEYLTVSTTGVSVKGPLLLPANPTLDFQAATKKYVDTMVPLSSLGTGIGNVLGPFVNFQGSGLPGILTSSRLIFQRGTAASSNTTDFQFTRNANYSGGTLSNVNRTVMIGTTVSSATAAQEWNLLAQITTSGNQGGMAVGAYHQAIKSSGGSDQTWATISDAQDNTGSSSATSGNITTHELDISADLADDKTNSAAYGGVGVRKLINPVAYRHTKAGTNRTEISWGIWFTQNDAYINYKSAIGFGINTQINSALDTRGAIVPTGSSNPLSAVTMSQGHVIDFNGGTTLSSVPGRTLSYDGTKLTYNNGTSSIFSVADDGTISGNVKPVGGLVPVNLSTFTADVEMLRSFGFVGGGSGATLASKYATLTAAQAVYPHAIALTDTLDWAALQGLYNYIAGTSANAVSIILPAGDIVVNRSIVTGSKSFYMRGQGKYQTRILMNTAGIDLFQHGLVVTNYFSTFQLSDLGLYCTVAGTNYAINIKQNTSSGDFRLENIRIASFSANFSWKGFVNAVGTTNSTFRDLACAGGSYGDPTHAADFTQVGFTIASSDNSTKAFVFTFDNCMIDAQVNAIQCNINGVPGNSGSLEGFIFTKCGGKTNTGPWLKINIPSSKDVWWPPYYIFDKCNMEGPGTLIDVDSVGEFHMTDCLMYVDAARVGDVATDYIKFNHARVAYITNNSFIIYANGAINNFIKLSAGSTNVVLRDNTFRVDDPSAILTGGIYNDPSNTTVTSFNNRYISWPVGIPKETNTSTSIYATDTRTVSFGNDNGTILTLDDTGAVATNSVMIQNAVTGSGPIIRAAGNDTNAPLNVQGKGTGSVNLGTTGSTTGPVTINGAICDGSLVTTVPATGFSNTVPNNCTTYLITPAGTLATGTLKMPAAPFDKQRILIATSQTITSFSVTANTGQSLPNSPTTLATGTSVEYLYYVATTTWYRLR